MDLQRTPGVIGNRTALGWAECPTLQVTAINCPCDKRPILLRHDRLVVGVLSAFQAAPRKTIIAESSIHTIKPITAARVP
jgi:hypothetical protein